jgi:hypothetical protein
MNRYIRKHQRKSNPLERLKVIQKQLKESVLSDSYRAILNEINLLIVEVSKTIATKEPYINGKNDTQEGVLFQLENLIPSAKNLINNISIEAQNEEEARNS